LRKEQSNKTRQEKNTKALGDRRKKNPMIQRRKRFTKQKKETRKTM
jgi:hypothetical protein